MLTDVPQFLRDLELVYAPIENVVVKRPPERFLDLHRLADVFDQLRADTLGRLSKLGWPDALPANDPLCCQVGLFGTLDLGLRETAHTRTWLWLLTPSSDHGFEDKILGIFLKMLFGAEFEGELINVCVEGEVRSFDDRDRLDIFAEGELSIRDGSKKTWRVVIEAKILADEGEEQLLRYENRLSKLSSADYDSLVYLTPDSRLPHTASQGKGREWKRLSFLQLMTALRKILPLLVNKPGTEFLRLYMTGVLKDIYGLRCGRIGTQDDIYRISDYLSVESNEN